MTLLKFVSTQPEDQSAAELLNCYVSKAQLRLPEAISFAVLYGGAMGGCTGGRLWYPGPSSVRWYVLSASQPLRSPQETKGMSCLLASAAAGSVPSRAVCSDSAPSRSSRS
eukprot:scaffold628020_cov34-Prasinocladus_malaysianus.AAC.1